MSRILSRLGNSLYMVCAVASKDVLEAVRSKTTGINILMAIGMVLFFSWNSTTDHWEEATAVAVYDPGNSGLMAMLESSPVFDPLPVSSMQELEEAVGSVPLGLSIPADFDRTLDTATTGTEGLVQLIGYLEWSLRFEAGDLEIEYEQQLAELLGQPVDINIGENLVVPGPDSLGRIRPISHTLMISTLWVALTVVPLLMMEEKQTKTMDALLISPASIEQVILGKALAGLFYILVCVGLVLVLNWTWFTSWGLALVGFTSSALLAIGLGLLIGTLADQPQKVTLWAMPVLLIALLPTQLLQMEDVLSAGVINAMSWIPTVGLVKVLRFSLSSGAPLLQILSNLGLALICTALVYGAIVWKVRRSDR